MAAINFPNSPALNEEFQSGNSIWQWNGSVWLSSQLSGAYTTSLVTAPSNGTTLTLARSNETYMTTQLTNSNSFTIGLATQISGYVNEYIFIFKTGASVPTLTQPSGIIWRGQTPLISTSETWTIVYEYVQVSSTPTWEIYGTAVKNV
jgi:hypothetical protein